MVLIKPSVNRAVTQGALGVPFWRAPAIPVSVGAGSLDDMTEAVASFSLTRHRIGPIQILQVFGNAQIASDLATLK